MPGPSPRQEGHAAVGGNGARYVVSGTNEPRSRPTLAGKEDDRRLETILDWETQQFQCKLQQQLQQLLDKQCTAISTFFEQSSLCLRQHLQQEMQNRQLEAHPLGSMGMTGAMPMLQPSLQREVSWAMESENIPSNAATSRTPREVVGSAATSDSAWKTAVAKSSGAAAAKADAADESPHSSQKRTNSSISQMVANPQADKKFSRAQLLVRKWMQGTLATTLIGSCIISNTIVMFVQLQRLGSKADASLGLAKTDTWRSADDVFRMVEYLFGVVYLVEFLLNVYAFRGAYFAQLFNVVDSAIVIITTLEVFVFESLAVNMGNVSLFRVFRLAKLARALRIFRTMTFFTSLRVLLASVAYSIGSLFWSLVVMFLMMLMCAIFLCQMLHEFVLDESADLALRTWVNHMFGSGDKSLYTVFEMTFSGCWPNYTSRLVKEVNPAYAFFFAVYVCFVIFGLVRIISALFLKETLQQAARDADVMVRERTKKTKRLKQDLNDLFDEVDTSGDGVLDMEELEDMLAHPKVRLWLGELGIDTSDTQMLFELLDNGDGEIQRDEFVNGITRIKGEARAQDLLPVSTNCMRILAHCKATRNCCERIAETMHI